MESSEPRFSIVYTTNGKLNGEMIKAFLESAGIPAMLNQESAGSTYGLTIGQLGEVEILVPAGKESEARKLLDAMDRGEFELGADEGDSGLPKNG